EKRRRLRSLIRDRDLVGENEDAPLRIGMFPEIRRMDFYRDSLGRFSVHILSLFYPDIGHVILENMNLLLLRGLIRDHRYWGEFPSRLQTHAPHLKVHFLDLPGVGTENERECPDTITAIRVDLAKRFHEKIAQGKLPKGPWSLLAISMGG